MTVGLWGALCRAALLLCATIGTAAAQGPAVSAPNGKIEFDAGALNVPTPGFMARAAGTLTLPVGDAFGVQADFAAASGPGFTTGAALHVFTRDPQSYLIGGTLGVVQTPGAVVLAAGPEAELYFGRWTLEAWAGVSVARSSAPGPNRVRPFGMADVAFYPDDNWRVSVGLSSLDGYNAVHFGGEYLLDNFSMPVSLNADARIGQDGAILATIGLRAYFGAPHKSLLRRHREDDPSDRGAALYSAVRGPTFGGKAKSKPLPDIPSGARGTNQDSTKNAGVPPQGGATDDGGGPDQGDTTSDGGSSGSGNSADGGSIIGADGCPIGDWSCEEKNN